MVHIGYKYKQNKQLLTQNKRILVSIKKALYNRAVWGFDNVLIMVFLYWLLSDTKLAKNIF